MKLFGALLAVGAAAIFARFALHGAGPLAVSALRLTLAAVPLVIFASLSRSKTRLGLGQETAFALAGLALALHFAAWIGSLLYTSVALATLLVCTTPLWTGLYDALSQRRLPRRGEVVALLLAGAGLALIALQRITPAPIPGHALLGDGLALCGAFAIGAYLVIVRNVGAVPLGGGEPIATRRIVARTYAWAALVLSIFSFAARQGPPHDDPQAWFGIVAMALVSQLIGHTLMNASLRDFTPSGIALATLVEPVIAALLAAWIFREGLSGPALGGGLLVLAAVGLVLRTGERPG